MTPADIEDLVGRAGQVMDVVPVPPMQSRGEAAASSAAAADVPISPTLPTHQTQTEMPTLSSASEEVEATPQFILYPALPAAVVVMSADSAPPMTTLATLQSIPAATRPPPHGQRRATEIFRAMCSTDENAEYRTTRPNARFEPAVDDSVTAEHFTLPHDDAAPEQTARQRWSA